MWMSKSSSALTAGYYYSLVGQKFWIIGSGSDCHILFKDALISSQHALLLTTAERKIYFSDLQSINGSFVNDQPILSPVLLVQGDLLKIGPYEIEFQDSSKLLPDPPSVPQKSVLLIQTSEFQRQVWEEILRTFGISIKHQSQISQSCRNRAEGLLTELDELPDLLIADIEALAPNPYGFCRWFRDYYPHIRVILTCSDRREIFESERRWAMHQGAFDFLPGFPQQNPWVSIPDVVTRVECVLQAVNAQVLQESTLEPILRSLMQRSSHPKQ